MADQHVGVAYGAALDAIEKIARVGRSVVFDRYLDALRFDDRFQGFGYTLAAIPIGWVAVAFSLIVTFVRVGDFSGTTSQLS